MKFFKTSFYFFATVFVLTTSVSAAGNKNIGDGGVRKLGKRAKASKEYVCDHDQYLSPSTKSFLLDSTLTNQTLDPIPTNLKSNELFCYTSLPLQMSGVRQYFQGNQVSRLLHLQLYCWTWRLLRMPFGRCHGAMQLVHAGM